MHKNQQFANTNFYFSQPVPRNNFLAVKNNSFVIDVLLHEIKRSLNFVRKTAGLWIAVTLWKSVAQRSIWAAFKKQNLYLRVPELNFLKHSFIF